MAMRETFCIKALRMRVEGWTKELLLHTWAPPSTMDDRRHVTWFSRLPGA